MAKLKLGYKASAEQFGPRDLVEFAVHAALPRKRCHAARFDRANAVVERIGNEHGPIAAHGQRAWMVKLRAERRPVAKPAWYRAVRRGRRA